LIALHSSGFSRTDLDVNQLTEADLKKTVFRKATPGRAEAQHTLPLE